jgi:hypothetical protein
MTSDHSLSADELYAEFQFALSKKGLGTFQRGNYIVIGAKGRPQLVRL